MIEVKLTLWTHYTRQDGTHEIKVYTHGKGVKEKRVGTGIHVTPQQWNQEGQKVVKHPRAAVLNAQLSKMVSDALNPVANDSFVLAYLERFKSGNTTRSVGTMKIYKALGNRLKLYEQIYGVQLKFQDLDKVFYDRFCEMLMQNCDCGLAGVGKHITRLKALMEAARVDGVHRNMNYKEKWFKKHTVQPETIYLEKREIELLENIRDTLPQHLQLECDRFLVAYSFLLRYSDSIKLRREHFFERNGKMFFRVKAQKTGIEAIVPVKQSSWRILVERNFVLEGDTNQEANRKLKEIARLAGITNVIEIDGQTGPKCNFVTTHTARRSGATNLYLEGAALKLIADLGGWKKIETLQIYLKITKLDSATAALGFDFFK